MEDDQGGNDVPPAARRFLKRHRLIGSRLRSAGHDIEGDGANEDADDEDRAEDQREVVGESRIKAHEVDGNSSVMSNADPEKIVPPAQLFALRPRAKGI